MSDPITIPLTYPLKAHNEEITELTIRAPKAKDCAQIGMPYKLLQDEDGGQQIIINAAVAARFLSALAKVPTSTIHAMEAPDFQAAIGALLSFFGESPGGTAER